MLGEFEFFSTDFNNWNFDNLINKPDFDPYNNKKKLDLSTIFCISLIALLC